MSQTLLDTIETKIASLIEPLGFEVVHLELVNQRQKLLRLYIDRKVPTTTPTVAEPSTGITVEDCAIVSRAVDEPLDAMPEVTECFGAGAYELEVSSPGVERPLRRISDFARFAGREARIHTFRPLNAAEAENDNYLAKNPRQKNFYGKLIGTKDDKVLVEIRPEGGPVEKAKLSKTALKKLEKNGEKPSDSNAELRVLIPVSLISKANLAPNFDFSNLGKQSVAVELDWN